MEVPDSPSPLRGSGIREPRTGGSLRSPPGYAPPAPFGAGFIGVEVSVPITANDGIELSDGTGSRLTRFFSRVPCSGFRACRQAGSAVVFPVHRLPAPGYRQPAPAYSAPLPLPAPLAAPGAFTSISWMDQSATEVYHRRRMLDHLFGAHPVLAWVDTKAMGWPEMRFALWGCQRGAARVGVLPKFLGQELASLWYYVLASAEDRATQERRQQSCH